MTELTFDWVSRRADRTPERTAIVDTGTGEELSYEAFDRRASRVAEFLSEALELEPGSRVAILSHNGAHYFETIYGCAKAETVYVALNWRLAPPELEYVLEDSTPDVLVYGAEFAETVETLRPSVDVDHYVSVGDPARSGDWTYEEALSAASGKRRAMEPRSGSDTWGLLYTSGTTGRPKGVRQTFDMVLYNYLNIGLHVDLTADDTTLNVLPCFHTGGLNLYANPTLLVGGTAIVQPTFDPTEALELLEERATVFFGVPAIYRALADQPGFEEADLSGVRSWSSGGAPMPVNLLEELAAHDVVVRQGMGMTETGPALFLIDEANALEKAGSIGKPSLFAETRVVDADGTDCPPGESGELLARGPGITPGYWKNPEANEAAFEDDWLHTGDVARVDDDGYYYLVDRMKNMFISGGENVYPAEVETVLHDHPAIAEAAVVGVPDEQWGEVGKAVVVLADSASIDASAVREFCDGRLARYKIPKHVDVVEELPRNAAGKIRRETLE